MSMVRVEPARLEDLYRRVFAAVGAPDESARIVAESLLDADLAGTDTHGVARVPIYVDRVLSGGTDPSATPSMISDSGSVVVMDGNNGFGQVAAHQASVLGLERAKSHGIASVAVRRSNHLGALAYYTRMAADNDCLSFAISGVAPTLAPWGGVQALLGSNPWSVACPAGGRDPVVLDMANGVITSATPREYAILGKKLPPGAAIDSRGNETVDPQEALAGSLLPIGGHKGYALTLVWEILASVLTGAQYSTQITSFDEPGRPKGIGHIFIVMDIARFMDPTEFGRRVEDLLDRILESEPRDGAVLRYPGMASAMERRERERRGIPIEPHNLDRLVTACQRVGIEDVGFL